MWTHALYGTDLYHFVQWFIVYSFLGWVVESMYMSFCNRKLTNRGFAFSPFCPIYAVGALSVFAILKPLAGNFQQEIAPLLRSKTAGCVLRI